MIILKDAGGGGLVGNTMGREESSLEYCVVDCYGALHNCASVVQAGKGGVMHDMKYHRSFDGLGGVRHGE